MEKIKLDEQKIKEFTKNSNETNKIELFSTEIYGKKHTIELSFSTMSFNISEQIKVYEITRTAAGDFFSDNDGYCDSVDFKKNKKVDFLKVYRMCQRQTNKFIEATNKQQKLIENAIEKNEKDVEKMAKSIVDIWEKIGMAITSYEDDDGECYDEFENLILWLNGILAQKND